MALSATLMARRAKVSITRKTTDVPE